jgi:hypothetical protein
MHFAVHLDAFGGTHLVAAVNGYARIVLGEVSLFLSACEKERQANRHYIIAFL